MAACKSLSQIFDDPRRPQTLLESLSPSLTQNPSPEAEDEPPPITEIFGELHFRDSAPDFYDNYQITKPPYSYESLHLCTEGLGFESSYDDVEQKQGTTTVNFNGNVNVNGDGDGDGGREMGGSCYMKGGYRRQKWGRGREKTLTAEEYPPPISSIGKNGKPRRSFKAYREEGRFVLEESWIPTREFLRASREDGRLTMKLVQPEEDEDDEEEEEEEEEEV